MRLNRLVIAVLFTIVSPINGQQNGTQTSAIKQAGQNTQWTIPCTVESNAVPPKCDWTHAKSDSYLERLFSPENAPNIALFVVGFVGVIVALCTLRKLSVQTLAAQDAARTALKQTEALIASERAWVVIKSSMEEWVPTLGEHPKFWWIVKNTGQTPARILETQCKCERVQTHELDDLPPLPEYSMPIEPNGFLLPPGGSADYYTFLEDRSRTHILEWEGQSDVDAMKIGILNLRVYGYVRYLDAFDTERESRFCEYYVWPGEEWSRVRGFRPLIGAPPEYTKHT